MVATSASRRTARGPLLPLGVLLCAAAVLLFVCRTWQPATLGVTPTRQLLGVGVSHSLLPTTLVVALSEDLIMRAAPALTRTGACLLPAHTNSTLPTCAPGSRHVLVYTTALLQGIPPGIRVVYLKQPAIDSSCLLEPGLQRSTQQAASTGRRQLHTNDTRSTGSSIGSSIYATCAALLASQRHYLHWRLLTRLWDTWLEVPVTALCDATVTSSFLGRAGPPCSRELVQHLHQCGAQGTFAHDARPAGGRHTPPSATAQACELHNVAGAPGRNRSLEYTSAPQIHQSGHGGVRLAWKPLRTTNLLCTFFPSPNAQRAEELRVSLLGNIHNPYVDSVHVFVDGNTTALQVPVDVQQWRGRVTITHMAQQPTYADLAEYANQHLQGQVAIMMNVDNVFTDGVQGFHSMAANQVFSISRHLSKEVAYANCEDHSQPGSTGLNQCATYIGSFDAFGFVAPLASEVVRSLSYKQNLMGADVATVAVFRHFGFEVINPCKDIVLLHNHCSRWRGGGATHPSLRNPPFGFADALPTTLTRSKATWLYDTPQRMFVEALPV